MTEVRYLGEELLYLYEKVERDKAVHTACHCLQSFIEDDSQPARMGLAALTYFLIRKWQYCEAVIGD